MSESIVESFRSGAIRGAFGVRSFRAVPSRPRFPASRRIKRLSFAGDGLAERIRSTVFAMLGLTAAAGLGLVLLFSQVGAPVLSFAPLPGPPAPGLAVGSGLSAGSGGSGASTVSVPGAGLSPSGLSALPPAGPGGSLGGPVETVFVDSGSHGGLTATADHGGSLGGVGSPQGATTPTANSPAESTDEGPDAEPPSSPVSGSSSSSGLFIRASVVKEQDDAISVSEASPVPDPEPEPEPEPEAPTEPEVPIVPTPEPETPPAPPTEPEIPVEPVAESEAPPSSI
jgi:hypothetical protein